MIDLTRYSMKIDFTKFDKYKVKYIKDLSESEILNRYCDEIWIFGSVINGNSKKQHTPFSDIDIAIFPKIKDLRSEEARKIHNEIRSILNKADDKLKYIKRDIVWVLDNDDYMLNEIKKGERIV